MEDMNNRRQAFENKYAHDLELGFRIEARAVRLFGLWVAEQNDMPKDEADLYADRLVRHNLKEPGLNDVYEKARADLNNDTISDHEIDVKLATCMQDAERQYKTDAA